MKPVDGTKLQDLFKKTLARKYPLLRLAYLHGSTVSAAPTPLSDVDIALVVETGQAKRTFWDLEIEIEGALEKAIPSYDFDVRVMNSAPIDYQGKVITGGRCLYASDPLVRSDYEEKTRKLYFDFKPFIDTYCEERLRTIRREGLTHG